MTQIVICVGCGESFSVVRKPGARKRYCSVQCRRRQQTRVYCSRHRDEVNARQRAYNQAHLDQTRARCRRSYEKHKEERKRSSYARYALLREQRELLSLAEPPQIKQCLFCGKDFVVPRAPYNARGTCSRECSHQLSRIRGRRADAARRRNGKDQETKKAWRDALGDGYVRFTLRIPKTIDVPDALLRAKRAQLLVQGLIIDKEKTCEK